MDIVRFFETSEYLTHTGEETQKQTIRTNKTSLSNQEHLFNLG